MLAWCMTVLQGRFFVKKHTITANIYLDRSQVYVLLLIYDTER
jgi:hypothetical protein